jgi:D-serine deaminase-like pyridoxal phosphate-dependent protein
MLTPDSEILRPLPTPSLVVDGAALTHNIAHMATFSREAGIALRPHAKTHKSTHIALLQKHAGAIGIACATIGELEAMAAAGIDGLLLTAPVMGDDKFARLARLNRAHGLKVTVDHPAQLEGLRAAMDAGDRPLGVFIDVDVGQARTGITDFADGVRLARMLAEQRAFNFAGIQGFAGHAQHTTKPAAREALAARAADTLRGFNSALTEAGLPPAIVSGSGTGTYRIDAAGPYTELQVGSYVFMDADYARITDREGNAPDFTPSLFVLSRVVSINRPGQVTVDAGTKALATNGPPPAVIRGAPAGASYRFAGDEHGVIVLPPDVPQPPIGARLLIGATHCDPTVNLHAAYRAVMDDRVTVWPIRGRYGE